MGNLSGYALQYAADMRSGAEHISPFEGGRGMNTGRQDL